MQIVLKVTAQPVQEFYPGPFGPGKRFIFSDVLVLEKLDTRTPGNGLPQAEQDRLAGTHAGFITTLDDGDPYQLQQEGTYRLSAVAGLLAGQVTVRGIFLATGGNAVGERRLAITGGTDAYAKAHGQVTESADGKTKTLDIVDLL